MLIKKILLMSALFIGVNCSAQIGYQVAVIDQSTGEPKANKTVTVKIELSDNSGSIFCNSTQSAETNEFGVVSLQIGDANTFSEVNWTKLPLWVNATVDGVNVGKTQILNVPVAEYAKQTGVLTYEKLNGMVCQPYSDDERYVFSGTGYVTYYYEDNYDKLATMTMPYEIHGNLVMVLGSGRCWVFYYSTLRNQLFMIMD